MSDPFVEKLNEKHLCSWYILPLLGLSVEQFGYDNYLDAYQVKIQDTSMCYTTHRIAVQILTSLACSEILKSPFFTYSVKEQDTELMFFNIPDWWVEDFELFLAGAYSKMSEEAKQRIREFSGLKYEVPDECGNRLTDAILMALDNHPVLRKKWMEVIGTSEKWMPEELLSPPAESSFITIESL